MMRDIQKYLVFIISPGRTGTQYFGKLLTQMIPDCYSIHEPDAWKNWRDSPVTKIRHFGVYQVLLGKFLGKTGVRNLSLNHLSGQLNLEQLKSAIYRSRLRFYSAIDQDLIVESHRGWFGAIDGIRALFPHYKIAVIVRDPRAWVVSNLNWGTLYGPKDKVSLLGLKRLAPHVIGDTAYIEPWKAFSRFEKLCWVWNAMYTILLEGIAGDPNGRVFLYEDLFLSDQRDEIANRFLEFITTFSDRRFPYHIGEGVLDKRIHATKKHRFTGWDEWSSKEAIRLDQMCGDLMKHFGYGQEPEWQKKIGKLSS